MKSLKYYALWREQLPMCLQPQTFDEHKECIDLILRCILFKGVADPYYQKELCDLKGDKITIQDYFDCLQLAEAKRSDYDTLSTSDSVDPASAISVNKYDYSSNSGNYRGKNNYRKKSQHQSAAAATVAVAVFIWAFGDVFYECVEFCSH